MPLNSHSNLRIEVTLPKANLSFGQIAAIDWDSTEVAPTVDFSVAVVALVHVIHSCDRGVCDDSD